MCSTNDTSDGDTSVDSLGVISRALRGRGKQLGSNVQKKQTNRRILLSLMCCNFVASLLCMNVSSFWPHLVQVNHPGCSEFSIGILIALQPFALILTTPVIGGYLIRIGRRRALYIGFWIATVATFMQFASAVFIANYYVFYGISMHFRENNHKTARSFEPYFSIFKMAVQSCN